MSRKTQETKKLRREVEILRAQLKGETQVAKTKTTPSAPPATAEVATAPESATHIREDLRRSLLITAAVLALIGGLTLSRSYWGG